MNNLNNLRPLPTFGKVRWSTIQPYSPITKTTFLKLGEQGKAPKPERMGVRCTFYDAKEVHRWLADPLGYTLEG